MDARIERKRKKGSMSIEEEVADMPMVGGRKLTELTSEEIVAQHEGVKPKLVKVPKKE